MVEIHLGIQGTCGPLNLVHFSTPIGLQLQDMHKAPLCLRQGGKWGESQRLLIHKAKVEE